jgi:hypothetical protein
LLAEFDLESVSRKKPGAAATMGVGSAAARVGTSRAITTRLALGANPPEDAIYMSTFTDADGHLLDGSARYPMHFDIGQTPPASMPSGLSPHTIKTATSSIIRSTGMQ